MAVKHERGMHLHARQLPHSVTDRMEFEFTIPGLAGQSISVWDSESIGRLQRDDLENLKLLLMKFGKSSAKAQGLGTPVTDLYRLRSTDQRLYLAATRHAGITTVLGGLKTGHKKLFLRTAEGELREVQPVCVLDFYVHESCQRQGIGKQLFQYFLAAEKVEAAGVAYDRPSAKLMGFLQKHFGLQEHVTQNNNFVVFNRFWQLCPAVPSKGRRGERQTHALPSAHSCPPATTKCSNHHDIMTSSSTSQQPSTWEPFQSQPRSMAYQTNCLPRQMEANNQQSGRGDGRTMLQQSGDSRSSWQTKAVHTQQMADDGYHPNQCFSSSHLYQVQTNTIQQESSQLLSKSDSLDDFRSQFQSNSLSLRHSTDHDAGAPHQPFSHSNTMNPLQTSSTPWHNTQPSHNQRQGYPTAPHFSHNDTAAAYVAAGPNSQGVTYDVHRSNDCNPGSKRNATGMSTSHVIPPWGTDQRQCNDIQQAPTSASLKQYQTHYARSTHNDASDTLSHLPARQLNGSNYRHDGSSAAGRPSMGSVTAKAAALAQRSGTGAAGCLVW